MLRGIDVSNWKRDLHLGSTPGDFIIAKATGGDAYVDPSCDMFVQAAIALGRKYGVYHYYADGYTGDDPIKEADWFVDNCLGYFGNALIVLDWEKGGNNYWQDTRRAKAWLDRVYSRTGVKPLIYMSFSLTRELDWSEVIKAGYGLWVAAYVEDGATPVAIPNYQMDAGRDPNPAWDGTVGDVMWQFTSTGRLDGYGANLDCNFFYGDASTWDAYARSSHPQAPPQPEPTTTTTTQSAPIPTTTTTTAFYLDDETTTTTTYAPNTTTTTTAAPEQPDDSFSLAHMSKAIAALIAGTIVTWAAKHGIAVTGDLAGLLASLFGGVVLFISVYFAPKNKEKKQ